MWIFYSSTLINFQIIVSKCSSKNVCTTNNIEGTWTIYNDHIRQIIRYIYLKLFGGSMCIMKIFKINSSNQWSQYFIFTMILNIHIRHRHPGVWFLQVNREEKVSGEPGSSLDPSAQVTTHIMSSKSQKSSQGTQPPRKNIVRMKTVKAALHIYFFRSVSTH